MLSYRVIAEFVDLETGRHRFPDEIIEVTSAARVKKMIEKGVIDPEPVTVKMQTDVAETAEETMEEKESDANVTEDIKEEASEAKNKKAAAKK